MIATTTDAARAVIDEALAQPTLARAFLHTATERADRVALREHGDDRALTYGEWLARSRAVAGGLERLGVGRGDRVALLLTNRLEFHVVDAGAMLLGAAAFSLYNTAPLEQLLPPVDNAAPTVLVAEAAFAERARALVAERPAIRLVLLGEAAGDELTLADLEASCPAGFDAEAAAKAVAPGDLLTLVYTSGTTGPPKGVQYLHAGTLFALRAFDARLPVSPGGRNVSYLPMAHIAERLLGHYAGFVFGYEITSVGDPARLLDALVAVRPTRFFGVPRIYEKLEPALERGEPTGLEEAEWLGVSGAPCAPGMMERFHAAGLEVSELWGMSESIIGTSAAPGAARPGSAGPPFDGFEIRLADDGEILVRSPAVTPGYRNDPVRTREAIDADGWLHTGDLGRFAADGHLSVVGRKKDLIINSAGKNMSPANIEGAIRGGDPLVAYVVVFGDGRPYNVALVALDGVALRAFAAERGLEGASHAALTAHPAVTEHVAALVAAGNARLSRVEQVKRWTVLEEEWAPGGDELTLTNKLRRAAVGEKHAARVDALYAAGDDQGDS